jgi:hypothetical protein
VEFPCRKFLYKEKSDRSQTRKNNNTIKVSEFLCISRGLWNLNHKKCTLAYHFLHPSFAQEFMFTKFCFEKIYSHHFSSKWVPNLGVVILYQLLELCTILIITNRVSKLLPLLNFGVPTNLLCHYVSFFVRQNYKNGTINHYEWEEENWHNLKPFAPILHSYSAVDYSSICEFFCLDLLCKIIKMVRLVTTRREKKIDITCSPLAPILHSAVDYSSWFPVYCKYKLKIWWSEGKQ